MRQFECYLCRVTFKTDKEPCIHYDEDEMDSEGEVSLCDSCNEIAQQTATGIEIGLSRRFFDCK